MFFITAKILSWLLEPLSWLFMLNAMALLFVWKRRYGPAGSVLVMSLLLTIAITELPLAGTLIRPLEQAFPSPILPKRIHGIIVLTGAEIPSLTQEYGKPQLNGEAERYTEFVALARAHPEAKLVVSGGSGRIGGEALSGAEVVRRFIVEQGLSDQGVMFEGESRNTAESAVRTRDLLRPQAGESWLLVTSANHMPRAAGAFRKAGFTIIPYPVSYHASRAFSWHDKGVTMLSIAVSEWVGIAAYRLTGRM